MSNTFEERRAEFQPYFGTLVIDPVQSIVELIDYIEEPDDYYYKLFSLSRGEYLSSGVGRIFPLKGRLTDEEYDSIKHAFDLNDWRRGLEE